MMVIEFNDLDGAFKFFRTLKNHLVGPKINVLLVSPSKEESLAFLESIKGLNGTGVIVDTSSGKFIHEYTYITDCYSVVTCDYLNYKEKSRSDILFILNGYKMSNAIRNNLCRLK